MHRVVLFGLAVIIGLLLGLSRVLPPLMPFKAALELVQGMMYRSQYDEGTDLASVLSRRPWLLEYERRDLDALLAWARFAKDPRCFPCNAGHVPEGRSIFECPQISFVADGRWLFAEEEEMTLAVANQLRRAGAPACALGLLRATAAEVAPLSRKNSSWRQAELAPLLDLGRGEDALSTARQILEDPLASPEARFWAGLRGTQALYSQKKTDEGRTMLWQAWREPVSDEVRGWGTRETGLLPHGLDAEATQR